MSDFYDLQKNRRSIYALGKDIHLSNEEIVSLIQNAIKESPTAFNSQSSRVVILLGVEHDRFWELVKSSIKEVVKPEDYPTSESKINGAFKAGYGTVLFYEDQTVIDFLQQQFPLYKINFPKFSLQSSGMAQYAVWVALAEKNIGASLQHYNELIEQKLISEFGISDKWSLVAQMPFGSIKIDPNPKDYVSDEGRFLILGNNS
ncbi:putative nitroreductase [Taylorella equigenitalis 14/56]|uniref:Nitroreductase family protein n=3 Tax=Taylorella equigenitalis TaxID=29575 RepID=A0A654KH90_TAYEM|nr:nitroreductase family protein [Taylorella equigenitalis]ADU91813.1 Nitroreductase family protein [Taylorella equigenitalis MCE9]AFN35378.1 putative nitroreductase [Taylorella equigenitalis ATCC 35865]ASY38809.1 nitroreductase [Taylorella equigenitalis]WDU53607.1 nitroreductase family protein [Taylorella equigenitalis]WDU55103.1 nitroreductase family protein [Taylorella equigenitalis]